MKSEDEVASYLEHAYCPVGPAANREPLTGIAVLSDGEIEAIERDGRKNDAQIIVDRLPDYLRKKGDQVVPALEILGRVNHPKFHDAAERWVPARGGLLLIGKTDEGKSAAMGYIFRRLLGRGVNKGGEAWLLAKGMQWLDATDIEAASGEHALGRGKAPEIVAASRASVLFIDDLGWDRDPAPLSKVLHARYTSGLVTVASTSRPQLELNQRYGGAALRWLFESGGPGRATVIDLLDAAPAASGRVA